MVGSGNAGIRKIRRCGKLYVHHPRNNAVQPVQALARILEIEALLKYVFFLQPVQGISDCSCGKIALPYYILLR